MKTENLRAKTGDWKTYVLFSCLAFIVFPVTAGTPLPAYTNHAGIAVSGTPVALTQKTVTLEIVSRTSETNATAAVSAMRETYPLSIFPGAEQRRIAADYAKSTGDTAILKIPQEVRRAIDGCDKAIRRSKMRAEKKLCSEEESKIFIEKTRAARKAYLDKAEESGQISAVERKLLD